MTNEKRISLVIPVYNEILTILDLLQTIEDQNHQPDEVIFVDGGSTDDTVGLLTQWIGSNPRYRILEAGRAYPGKGRNIGAAAAIYEWIAFTDAGIRLNADWLEQLISVAKQDSTLDVVYGNYEPVVNTFFERCASLAYLPLKQDRPSGMMRGPSIVSCLIRKSVWEAVGGFPDFRAAEDLIFMRRIEDAGFRIGWAPEATVWWQLRPDLWSTFKKFVLYSKHNAWARQQRYWHHGLARQYIAWLLFSILAVFHSPWWALVPGIGYLGRVAKSIWIRREGRGILWAMNLRQFLGVMVILLTIDLATFLGWIQSKIQSPRAGQGIT